MPWLRPGPLLARLSLAAAAVCCGGNAAGAAVMPADPGPALTAVVKYLGHSDPAGSEDLAWIALSEMVQAYEQMLERAGQARHKDAESRAKLRKWRAATAGFLAGLRSQLHAVASGAAVTLDTEPDGSLLVLVEGRPTLVSDPDLAHPGALGRRILETFCGSHDCPAAALNTAAPAPAPPPPVSTGHWSFADHRSTRFETQGGIAFEFSGFQDRSEKQAASDQLAAELRLLARGLRDVQSIGQPIDWDVLRIVPTPGGENPRVILNRNGDFLYLAVPELVRRPELLREARPWIEARMAGRPYDLVLNQAERLVHPSEPDTPTE